MITQRRLWIYAPAARVMAAFLVASVATVSCSRPESSGIEASGSASAITQPGSDASTSSQPDTGDEAAADTPQAPTASEGDQGNRPIDPGLATVLTAATGVTGTAATTEGKVEFSFSPTGDYAVHEERSWGEVCDVVYSVDRLQAIYRCIDEGHSDSWGLVAKGLPRGSAGKEDAFTQMGQIVPMTGMYASASEHLASQAPGSGPGGEVIRTAPTGRVVERPAGDSDLALLVDVETSFPLEITSNRGDAAHNWVLTSLESATEKVDYKALQDALLTNTSIEWRDLDYGFKSADELMSQFPQRLPDGFSLTAVSKAASTEQVFAGDPMVDAVVALYMKGSLAITVTSGDLLDPTVPANEPEAPPRRPAGATPLLAVVDAANYAGYRSVDIAGAKATIALGVNPHVWWSSSDSHYTIVEGLVGVEFEDVVNAALDLK